jgi:hypothetical protein
MFSKKNNPLLSLVFLAYVLFFDPFFALLLDDGYSTPIILP